MAACATSSASAVRGPGHHIAVDGCVARPRGGDVVRQPAVGIVVDRKNSTVSRAMAEDERKAASDRRQEPAAPADQTPIFGREPVRSLRRRRRGVGRRSISIQDGCAVCHFGRCLTAGAEYSSPVVAVLDEARQLLAAGRDRDQEAGPEVKAYNGEAPPRSIGGSAWCWQTDRALCEIAGVARIRYTTSIRATWTKR